MKEKIKDDTNVQEIKGNRAKILEITVAGVPKSGALGLKDITEFKDNFKFEFKYTNKNLLMYCENQEKCTIIDYQGNEYTVEDKSRLLYCSDNIHTRESARLCRLNF